MSDDIKFYTPPHIPPEILAYEAELLQLKPGKAGKIGALMLKLEENPETKKTVIKDQFARVPLFTQKALYLEESFPSMAYVYIMTPSGGILQGDRYRIDLTLSDNAHAHLTTQGATRIYKMERNYATQMVNITVDDDCYLEYIPDQIIPFKDSRFYQIVNAKVHENGTLVYSEMLAPGRVASGESFEYDIVYMATHAENQKGASRFTDVFILEPKKSSLKVAGILGEHYVVGSLYILTKPNYAKQLIDEINNYLNKLPGVRGGATLLPYNSGVMVRMLGNIADDLKSVIYEIVNIVRKTIIGAPFSGIRKY
ncbi:MAG: urease accessory protein UreD [Candidatus Bathyarchaeia archaeon]